MRAFLHGHTFTGNPLSCAAALASLDVFEEPQCQRERERIARSYAGFAERLQSHPLARNIRYKGIVLAFEAGDEEASQGYTSGIRDRLYDLFIERKVLVRPLGSTVYLLPPYCISDEQLDVVYAAIVSVLDEVQSGK